LGSELEMWDEFHLGAVQVQPSPLKEINPNFIKFINEGHRANDLADDIKYGSHFDLLQCFCDSAM